MTKDEEQMIANLMHRMHANEQARIESALATARMDAVTRAEADRVRIEALTTERDQWKFSHTDLLGRLGFQAAKEAGKVLGMSDGEGLRGAAERVVKERDGLLTQVQDQRAEIERLRNDERKAYQDGEALRAEVADLRGIVDMVHASLGIKRGDHIGNAIAQLKAQTPKRSHPVAVGEYLRRLTGFSTTPAGEVAQVLHVACGQYTVKRPNGQQGVWFESGCEPCDPPEATHDTEAGKAAAQNAEKTEQAWWIVEGKELTPVPTCLRCGGGGGR